MIVPIVRDWEESKEELETNKQQTQVGDIFTRQTDI